MGDIEQHGVLGGKTFFFPSSEHSTDMKTVNDNIVAISDYYIFIFTFFKGKPRV